MTRIDGGVFMGNGLTNVTVPGSVTEMGEGGFMQFGNLTSAVISPGVKGCLWAFFTTAIAGWYTKSNGGDVLMDSKTVLKGSACRELPVLTRAGYHFTGWYTKTSGGSTGQF